MTGTDGLSPSYTGQAGEFSRYLEGALSVARRRRCASATLDAAAPTSFVAWCAELTQTFSFGVSYEYTPVSGACLFRRAED